MADTNMTPSEHSAVVNAQKTEERVTLRLPLEAHAAAVIAADSLDRSLNWWIVEAVREKLDREKPKVQFPESQFGSAGFTYMATFTWNMPGFDTGLPESDTELIIDRMMTEVCHTVRDYGAQDIITVDGPWMVQPMALRKTRNYPEGTTLQHGAGASIVDDGVERQRPPDDTGSWVGDKASE